ncbi:hypothetical protein EVAR_50871_1 [Eumeta japonica]|uniref:Uncharacterized protein n=1 Tax=Eumeta variegata TaxID=151549 RepID=A0A4C1Y8N1_EUMVA|nr:hypothetical protein EVAR_50871_1 [Eumeta japonica]
MRPTSLVVRTASSNDSSQRNLFFDKFHRKVFNYHLERVRLGICRCPEHTQRPDGLRSADLVARIFQHTIKLRLLNVAQKPVRWKTHFDQTINGFELQIELGRRHPRADGQYRNATYVPMSNRDDIGERRDGTGTRRRRAIDTSAAPAASELAASERPPSTKRQKLTVVQCG